MKIKQILPLLLIMVIFTACRGEVINCGCEASNCAGSISNSDGNAPNPESNTSNQEGNTSGYWGEWIKDVPHGEFERTDSETLVWEHNGYSVEFEIEKWTAARGSSEYIMHPASDEIPLPLLQPSDCVIPFVLTARTTTKDSDFTTDFTFNISASLYNGTYNYPKLFRCGPPHFEDTVERLTNYFDNLPPQPTVVVNHQEIMSQHHRQMWRQGSSSDTFPETKQGDEQIFLGCYVINNYYSPEFPDGNLELFPSGSAMLRVSINGDPVQGYEELEVVMY